MTKRDKTTTRLPYLYGFQDFKIVISGGLHSFDDMTITLTHTPTGTTVTCQASLMHLKKGIRRCEEKMKKELLEANIATLDS